MSFVINSTINFRNYYLLMRFNLKIKKLYIQCKELYILYQNILHILYQNILQVKKNIDKIFNMWFYVLLTYLILSIMYEPFLHMSVALSCCCFCMDMSDMFAPDALISWIFSLTGSSLREWSWFSSDHVLYLSPWTLVMLVEQNCRTTWR